MITLLENPSSHVTLPRMTDAQRRVRRLMIAQEAKAGERTVFLAARYGVSKETVCAACREFGVDISGRTRGRGRGWIEIEKGAT